MDMPSCRIPSLSSSGRPCVLEATQLAPGSSASYMSLRRIPGLIKEGYHFVEVPDGRVSRLHCTLALQQAAPGSVQQPAVLLEDCSLNGTFLNGSKLGPGRAAALADGDRVSLVLSVAPLAEQCFTFWRGQPSREQREAAEEAGEDTSRWGRSTLCHRLQTLPCCVQSGGALLC